MATVQERLEELLSGMPHAVLDHPASHTASEAALVRGTALDHGGKAIVMKVHGHGFVLLALRGSDVVDGPAFRHHLGVQRYRFASREELFALTGLVPGCVPPFGRPIFELPLFADQALVDAPEIVFTTGAHTRSARMATEDWLRLATPERVWTFARPG